MRRKRYPKPQTFLWVTAYQIAMEIDRTLAETQKVITRAQRLGLLRTRIHKPGTADIYSAIEAETIKAMLAVPDRPAPQQRDWLSDYLKENTHARRQRP